MNCIKSDEGPYPGFVTKSCWMRGLFLYKELMAEPRPSIEFGIPDDIGDDHIQNNCLISRCTGPGCKKNDEGLLFVVPMGTLSLLEFFIFSSDALFSV